MRLVSVAGFVVVLGVLGACGRPGHGNSDDTAGDDVGGDDGPGPDASACIAGDACVPELACHGGVTACDGGQVVCASTEAVADGTECGRGNVCDRGECVPACDAGLDRCSGQCVDLQTDEAHCGDCTTACDADATCVAGTCKPGAPHAANGVCTQIDQPGWLSCPTGMSCQCYYHYYKIFIDKPAKLDTWLSSTSLQVFGGMLPPNQVMSSPTPATIALAPNASGVLTGAYYPYQVTVTAGVVEIKLRDTDGYIPAKFVLQTSADCGNRGQILECTFH